MTIVLLLLCNLLASSQSAPEPDTHLHVYLPPEGEQGRTPNTGGGYANNGLMTMTGTQGNPALSNDYSANAFSASFGRNGQGLQPRSSDYAENVLNPRQFGQSDGQDYATASRGFIDANKKYDRNTEVECGSSNTSFYKDEIIGGRVAEPNAFPWMVQLKGGCLSKDCGGALITSKHILTAYHCLDDLDAYEPCGVSAGDELGFAILGQNELDVGPANEGTRIPVIEALYPKKAGFNPSTKSVNDHDFAMYILKDRVTFSSNIVPICLPPADESYAGEEAVAAGWGMFAKKNKQFDWTYEKSPLLKRVNLRVSKEKFKHKKMLGTEIEGPENTKGRKGEPQDVCLGDGGGPLMFPTKPNKWVIIGTVYGGGYNCETGKTALFEDKEVGIWNKVSAHTKWILEAIKPDEDSECFPDCCLPCTGRGNKTSCTDGFRSWRSKKDCKKFENGLPGCAKNEVCMIGCAEENTSEYPCDLLAGNWDGNENDGA